MSFKESFKNVIKDGGKKAIKAIKTSAFEKAATGADDVYVTDKNIGVRKVTKKYNRTGLIETTDTTRYFPKTPKNMLLAEQLFGKPKKNR
jgi:hypothetical protein